jgi:fermentation-respiration switch protein FrsA (DUF1100 family)
LLGGYLAAVAILYFAQRSILFEVADSSSLSEPGTLAIGGSTRIAIPTADGETLAGWYVPPAGEGVVFLYMHGQKGALHRKRGRWRRVVEKRAGLLAFSYRGYPGSTGRPSEAGLHEDARAAYAWLRARHGADRIVLHGQSLGTGVATRLATEVEARALILETPYTAVVDLAAERYPFAPVRLLMWDQFRSYKWIGQVRMPVLVAHGTRDSIVPFSHGERMFAMASAARQKVFVRMEGSDHLTLTRDGLYPHIWRFLGLAGQ